MRQTKEERREAKNVMPLANLCYHIAPQDIEEIMEFLQDHNYLNEKGCQFKTAFWRLFILK